MPEGWTVRRAHSADLPALTMLSAANRMYHANVEASVEVGSLVERRERYAGLLAADNALVLLAEATDGSPIACFAAIFYPPRGEAPARAYVEDAFVIRPWRRRGVLASLVAELVEACHERGIAEVDVDYLAENPAGAAAWTKLGFAPRSVRATATVGALARRRPEGADR